MKVLEILRISIFLLLVTFNFYIHCLSLASSIKNNVEQSGSGESEMYATPPNILCFYTHSDTFRPDQIITEYCSHILTFGSIQNYSLSGNMEDIADIVALKAKNTGIKFILSILATGSNSTLSQIVNSPELTENFTKQSLQFLHDHNIDGIDFDWEFPSAEGDPATSKQAYPMFLQHYMESANDFSNSINIPRPIITIDVSALVMYMDISYNITEIAKYVDYVNIMCYDYHFYEWYDCVTDSNSPLYNRTDEPVVFDSLNLDWTVKEWNKRGMPKSKINVGIPSYGHTYNLSDPEKHGFDALATGPGIHGGDATYNDVCEFIKGGSTVVFDEESQVPYTYKDYDWISYDNIQSTTAKTKYILDNGYAGIMIWSTNNDDYLGECDGQTRFPIIGTVFNVSRNYLI